MYHQSNLCECPNENRKKYHREENYLEDEVDPGCLRLRVLEYRTIHSNITRLARAKSEIGCAVPSRGTSVNNAIKRSVR